MTRFINRFSYLVLRNKRSAITKLIEDLQSAHLRTLTGCCKKKILRRYDFTGYLKLSKPFGFFISKWRAIASQEKDMRQHVHMFFFFARIDFVFFRYVFSKNKTSIFASYPHIHRVRAPPRFYNNLFYSCFRSLETPLTEAFHWGICRRFDRQKRLFDRH